jgi:hypothetical protein
MDVRSVSNALLSTWIQAPQPAAESAEVKEAGPDRDGDADDGGGAKVVQPAVAATVNTNGQKTGQVINATA